MNMPTATRIPNTGMLQPRGFTRTCTNIPKPNMNTDTCPTFITAMGMGSEISNNKGRGIFRVGHQIEDRK